MTGTLASVGTPDSPRIRFYLDRIDTVAGPLPLHAAVRRAEHSENPGPGDGHGAEGRAMMQPRDIFMPAGAAIELVLVDPLLLPGTRLLVH